MKLLPYPFLLSVLLASSVECFATKSAQPSLAATKRLLAAEETLVFTGDYVYESDPVQGCTREDVISFFNEPTTQLFLISAGGKREVERHATLTADMKRLWLGVCEKFGSSLDQEDWPSDSDEAVACDSIIQFPGLQLITTVLNGVKTRIDENGFPEYVFVLIGEKKRATGPAPIVWLYNKLTNADKEDAKNYILPETKAKSTVSIVEGEDEFSFKFTIEIQVQVGFPTSLIRILPTSKETMEEQGSAAVLKTVSGDIVDSITATRNDFLKRLNANKNRI